MIDELKKNIDTEIAILREISGYSQELAFATPDEAKLVELTVKNLSSSLKLINNSLPKIVEGITFVKRLSDKKKKTNLENIGFQRRESLLNVILNKTDREKFLKKLSIKGYKC